MAKVSVNLCEQLWTLWLGFQLSSKGIGSYSLTGRAAWSKEGPAVEAVAGMEQWGGKASIGRGQYWMASGLLPVCKLQNGLNRAGGQWSLLWQQECLQRVVQVGAAGEHCACFCGEEQEQRSGWKKIHLCCQIANQGLRSSTEGDEVFTFQAPEG